MYVRKPWCPSAQDCCGSEGAQAIPGSPKGRPRDSPKSADGTPHSGPSPQVPPVPAWSAVIRAFAALVLKVAAAAAILWVLFTYAIGVHIVHDNDMYPSVRDGDLLVTSRFQEPARDSIVCYMAEGKERVGRVVALEGDVVDIDGSGGYTVNGGVPTETVFYDTFPSQGAGISYPYTVPQGHVFILNDMRDSMGDSRSIGAVPADLCKGGAVIQLRHRSW